jgi:hypothetical protein
MAAKKNDGAGFLNAYEFAHGTEHGLRNIAIARIDPTARVQLHQYWALRFAPELAYFFSNAVS